MNSAGELGQGLVYTEPSVVPSTTVAEARISYLAATCRRYFAIGDQLPAELRPDHQASLPLVRLGLQHHRRAMLACFAAPAVGSPLQCLGLQTNLEGYRARIDRAAAAIIPQLLFEMGLRGILPETTPLRWNHGALPLTSLAIGGSLLPPESADQLTFVGRRLIASRGREELASISLDRDGLGAAEQAGGDRFHWQRTFWPIAGVTHLAMVDPNPIASFEAHPDKSGNPIDLGGVAIEDWRKALDQSVRLIQRFLPGIGAEIPIVLQQFIPVGYSTDRHLSASYREAIGTVYLTLHPNVMTMTEAIIHEFQHNKLNLASYSSNFLENAFAPLYPSPVRPDPRPLWGILLAVHAFLPVAEIYRRMRDGGHPWAEAPGFQNRLMEIDGKNQEGLEMLRRHAVFTPSGERVFADLTGMAERHREDRQRRGQTEPVPTEVHSD